MRDSYALISRSTPCAALEERLRRLSSHSKKAEREPCIPHLLHPVCCNGLVKNLVGDRQVHSTRAPCAAMGLVV